MKNYQCIFTEKRSGKIRILRRKIKLERENKKRRLRSEEKRLSYKRRKKRE